MDDHPRHSAVLRYSTLWREKLGCNQIPFFWTLSVTAWGWHIRIHDVIRHDVFHNICWRMLMIVKRCDEFKSVCARSQCCGPRTHTHCRWICNISCVCWHNVVKFLHRHIWTDIERHAHTRPQTHTHRHAIQFSQRVWLICCPCNKSISISHKPDNICFFYYESQPGSWLVAGWKVYGWKVCARRVSGWRVSGWKVYGWKVCARRVSGWKVCAIRVSGWRVSGWKVCARRVSGWRVSGWKILGNIGIDGMLAFVPPSQVRFPIIGKQRSPFYMNYHMFSIQTWHV